jgi:hypothetical protein
MSDRSPQQEISLSAESYLLLRVLLLSPSTAKNAYVCRLDG